MPPLTLMPHHQSTIIKLPSIYYIQSKPPLCLISHLKATITHHTKPSKPVRFTSSIHFYCCEFDQSIVTIMFLTTISTRFNHHHTKLWPPTGSHTTPDSSALFIVLHWLCICDWNIQKTSCFECLMEIIVLNIFFYG